MTEPTLEPRSRQRRALALASVALAGCMHTALIESDPSQADVTLNGVYLGRTPVRFEDRSGVRRAYFLTLVKPGYEKTEVEVESVYKADLSLLLLVAGVLPYFFTAELEDAYQFRLRPGG